MIVSDEYLRIWKDAVVVPLRVPCRSIHRSYTKYITRYRLRLFCNIPIRFNPCRLSSGTPFD